MTTTRERPVRSTRARAPSQTQAPRSTRSTRATPAMSTRRPKPEPERSSAPRRMIRRDPVPQQQQPEPGRRTSTRKATDSGAKPVQSTRRVLRSEPADVTRTEIFTEKREQARFLAPAKFLLTLFGVVVVSVFAFGLLRDDSEMTLPEKPDPNEVIEVDSTSTNTGILRGGGN